MIKSSDLNTHRIDLLLCAWEDQGGYLIHNMDDLGGDIKAAQLDALTWTVSQGLIELRRVAPYDPQLSWQQRRSQLLQGVPLDNDEIEQALKPGKPWGDIPLGLVVELTEEGRELVTSRVYLDSLKAYSPGLALMVFGYRGTSVGDS